MDDPSAPASPLSSLALLQHHCAPSSLSSSADLLQQLLQLQRSLLLQPAGQSQSFGAQQNSCKNAMALPSPVAAATAPLAPQQRHNNLRNLSLPSSSATASTAQLNNNLPSPTATLLILQQQQQQQLQQQQQVLFLGRFFQCHWPFFGGQSAAAGAAALLLEREGSKTNMATSGGMPMIKGTSAKSTCSEKLRSHRRRDSGGTMPIKMAQREEEKDTKPNKLNDHLPISAADQPAAAVISRPGFSIDGLLAVDSGGGAPSKVDYFMEEGELCWTDGRRSRKSHCDSAGDGTAVAKATTHKKRHHPPLPTSSGGKHVCTECKKSYATSSNLSRHKQTHRSWEHAKKCHFCEKAYVSMPAFTMHLKTHTDQHKCNMCGKCFSRPWLLSGHMRSHTGHKPYGCGNCGKTFSDKSNLRAHLYTHNNEKRWHCAHCGRDFAVRSYLSKHLEQQHNRPSGGMGAGKRSGRKSGGGTEEMCAVLPSDGLLR